jgi:hypothetical protein
MSGSSNHGQSEQHGSHHNSLSAQKSAGSIAFLPIADRDSARRGVVRLAMQIFKVCYKRYAGGSDPDAIDFIRSRLCHITEVSLSDDCRLGLACACLDNGFASEPVSIACNGLPDSADAFA